MAVHHGLATVTRLFGLMRQATSAYPLDLRQRGILVAACASTFGDSLCSVAWGSRLASAAVKISASWRWVSRRCQV